MLTRKEYEEARKNVMRKMSKSVFPVVEYSVGANVWRIVDEVLQSVTEAGEETKKNVSDSAERIRTCSCEDMVDALAYGIISKHGREREYKTNAPGLAVGEGGKIYGNRDLWELLKNSEILIRPIKTN